MPTIEELRKQYGSDPVLKQTVAAQSAIEAPQYADIDVKKAYEYGYDPTFKTEQEDGFARAYQENSSWTERWGNRGKSLAAQTTLEALGGLTAMAYGIGAYGASALSGNADITKVFDNDFSRMLDSYREDIQKNYQNYYTKEQQDSIAGWVGSGKFIDDLTGGASFLLGAALTEAAAGLLTAGTLGAGAPLLVGNTARITARAASLLKKADKAGDFTKLVSYADDAVDVTKSVRNLKRATESGNLGRQWLLTGAGYEASVEALGAKKEYEAKIDAQLSRGEITTEKAIELKQRADEAATATYFTNLALVGVSNMVQFSSLFRPDILTTMSKVPSRYKMGTDGISNVDSLYNKFRRGSRYATNVGAEALEEFTQTAINKTGESYVFNKYDTENNAGVLQTMNNFVKHAAEGVQNSMNQEGLQSAILGGVMGATGLPTFGLTRGADGKRQWLSGGISEAKNENIEEVRRVNELQKKFNSNTKQDAIQFIAETMGSENTKANWVNGVQQHTATQIEELALKSGNVMAAKNAEHDRLFSFVQNRQQVGQASDIQDMLNGVKEMSPEQFAAQFGYDNLSKEELAKRKEETVKKAKERIDNINGALKQVESAFPQMSEDWKTAAAYNLSKAKDVKTRLDEISSKLTNELQITTMFEEAAKSSQAKRDSVQADYESKIGAFSTEREAILAQLKEAPTGNTDKLVNKRDKLTDQIGRLTEALKTDLKDIDAALEQVKKSSQVISKKGKSITDLDNLFLKNTEAINNAIEQIAQEDPAKAAQLSKDFKDFKTLRDTHKRVIDEYNRLLTPQGTQAFEAKVETAKKEGTPEVAKQPQEESQSGQPIKQETPAGVSNVADDLDLAMDSTLEDPEAKPVKESTEKEKINFIKKDYQGMSPKINVAQGTIEIKRTGGNFDAAVEGLKERLLKDFGKDFMVTIIEPKVETSPEVVPAIAVEQPVGEVENELIVRDGFVYKENADLYIQYTNLDEIDPTQYKIVTKTYDNNPSATFGLDKNEPTYEIFYTLPSGLDVYVGYIEDSRYDRINGKVVTDETVRLWAETVHPTNVEYHIQRWKVKKELTPKLKSLSFKTNKAQFHNIEDPKNYLELENYKFEGKTIVMLDNSIYEIKDNTATRITNPQELRKYNKAIEDRNTNETKEEDKILGRAIAYGDAIILTDKFILPAKRRNAKNPNAAKESQDIILAVKDDSQGFIINSKKDANALNEQIKLKIMLDQEVKAEIKFDERNEVKGRYNLQFIAGSKKAFFKYDAIKKEGLAKLIEAQCTAWGIKLVGIDNYPDNKPETTFTPNNWRGSKRIYRKVVLTTDQPVAVNTPAVENIPQAEVVEKQVEQTPAKVVTTDSKVDILRDVIESGKSVQDMIKDLEAKGLSNDTKGAFIQAADDASLLDYFDTVEDLVAALKNYTGKVVKSQESATTLKPEVVEVLRNSSMSIDELFAAKAQIKSIPNYNSMYGEFEENAIKYKKQLREIDSLILEKAYSKNPLLAAYLIDRKIATPYVEYQNPSDYQLLAVITKDYKTAEDVFKKYMDSIKPAGWGLGDNYDYSAYEAETAKPKVQNQSNPILSRDEAIGNISAIIPAELISDEELNIAARNIQAVGDIEGLYDKFIYLARVITPGTEYHEAFHAVFNALISPSEKQNLMQQWLMVNPKPSKLVLNRFKNSYSGYSTLSEAELLDEYIEESLADEFAKYMDKNAKPKALIGRIFDRIKRWLGLNSKIDQFFDLIKRGAFKNKPRYDEVNKVRVAKPNVLYADANKQNPLETRAGHVVITRIAQKILSGQYSGKGIKDKITPAINDVADYYKTTYIDDVAVRKSLSQDTINSVKSIIRALRNPENKEIIAQELELIRSLYAADEDEENEIEDLESRNSDEGIVTKPVNQQDGFSKENIWKLWTVNTLYTDREFDGGPMVELPIDYYATQMHIKMLAKNYPKDRLWDVIQTFALNPNEVELKALLKRLEATIRKELNNYEGDLTHAKMSDSFMYNAFILSNYKTDVEMFDLFWSNNSKSYEIGSANNSSIKRTTVNKWINNLATKSFTKDELVDAFKGIEKMLKPNKESTVQDIASALNRVGIDVSYDYIKYNVYKLGIQEPFGEDLVWFNAIQSDEIPTLMELITPTDATSEHITKRIQALDIPTNIYADISGWLEKVAIGDSLFNTAVRKSTFKNIEGKTIYEIIYNSAESERMRAISNPRYKELVAEIKRNLKADPTSLRKETLKFMEFMNIPYQEYLTYQELVQWIADNPLVELLSKVEPKFIGGYKDQNDNRKMFSEGDAKVKQEMLLSFATRGKKRKDTINYHLLNVKAGKTLQTIYGVPDQGFGVVSSESQILGLNEKTKDVLLDFFKQEFNRIQRAAAFKNSPRVETSPDFDKAYKEEIKAYTDFKRKRGGLAFMQHADFIKEVVENPSYKSHKAFVEAGGKYETLKLDEAKIKQDLETYWMKRAEAFITENEIKRDKIETVDAYINDAIISRGLYQLLAYDPALTVKDAIDQNKRAGSDGAAGPSSSGRIRFGTVSSMEYKLGNSEQDADYKQYDTVRDKIAELVKSKVMSQTNADKALEKLNAISESNTDTSDATSFMTTEAYIEHYLKPFLKYDSEVAEVYKKIAAGIVLDKDDTSIINKKNAHANPRKLVYSNGVDYIKTATNVLTRYEFSIAKNDDAEFLMAEYNKFLDAKREYMSQLEDLEKQLAYEEINLETFDTLRLEAFGKYEPIVKAYHSNFIAIPGSEVGHATLNRMQLHGFDMIGVDSSSKKQKRKVGKLDSFNYHNTQVLDASYLREQVATDGVKVEVIDGTQKLSLIWSEQGTVTVKIDGVDVRIDNLSKAMQVQLGKRIVQGFQDLMPKIEKEGLAYYDYLKESLIASQQASGGNNYFIEFLQDDYNWNLPHIVGKVEASFFSATSKNTLKHKTAGTAVALLPGTMYNVLRDENDNVVTRNYVRKHWKDILNDDGTLKKPNWKVTRLRHLVWDESLGVFVSEAILPEIHENIRTDDSKSVLDVFKYMVGIRIPTQDKQSMLAIKLVDTLPAYKGSLGVMPAESVKLSGEDFDIDKKFINYFSTYKTAKKPVKFGNYLRTGNLEDAWQEFVKSKYGQDYLSTLLEGAVSQKTLNILEDKIADMENQLAETPDDFDLKTNLQFEKDRLRELELSANSKAIKESARTDFFVKYKKQVTDNIDAFKQGKFGIITPITLEESNNILLDMQLRMISNPDNLHIALTPAEMTPVEESIKLLTKYTDPKYANASKDDLDKYVDNQEYVYVQGNHALDDKLKAFNNNDVGSKNIGVFALANTFFQYVMAEKIEPFYSTNFEIPNLGRINDIISAFLSSSTDNDKVQHAAVLGLDQESSGILGVSIMMGYNPVEIGIPMLNRDKVRTRTADELDNIDAQLVGIVESFGGVTAKSVRSFIEDFKKKGSVEIAITPEISLTDGLTFQRSIPLTDEIFYRLLSNPKTSYSTNSALAELFTDIEKVGKSVSKVQKVMSLNKGFKPTIYDNLLVLKAVNDLARLKQMGKEPFPAYDLIMTHPYLKANVQAAQKFLNQGGVVSKFFLMATDKIREGFQIVNTMSGEAAKDAMVKSMGIEVMNSILNSDEELAKLSTDLILNEKGDFTLTAHNLLKASKFGKMYMMKVLVPNRVVTDSENTYSTLNLDTWAVSNKFTEEKLQSNFTFANSKPSKKELRNLSLYTEKLQDLMKRFKSIDSITDNKQRKDVLDQIVEEFETNDLELKDGALVSVADILLNDYSKRLQAQAVVKDVMQFRNGSVVKLLNPRSWKKISSLFDTQQKAITKKEPTVFDSGFVEKSLVNFAMAFENFTFIETIDNYKDKADKYSEYKVSTEVKDEKLTIKFGFTGDKPMSDPPVQYVLRDSKGIKWIVDGVTAHGKYYPGFDEAFSLLKEYANEVESLTYKAIDPERTYWGNSEVLPHRHDKSINITKKKIDKKDPVDTEVKTDTTKSVAKDIIDKTKRMFTDEQIATMSVSEDVPVELEGDISQENWDNLTPEERTKIMQCL